MTGRRWPDPGEPGVPAEALADSFHWLAWPGTGAPTMGQWSPDLWRWVVTFWGEMVTPENMAHLDYVGIANPPYINLPHDTRSFDAQGIAFHTCAGDFPAEVLSYMTTKKSLILAASPQTVFSMFDRTESRERQVERIEQFCQLIPHLETAATWRHDLLCLLHQRRGTHSDPDA